MVRILKVTKLVIQTSYIKKKKSIAQHCLVQQLEINCSIILSTSDEVSYKSTVTLPAAI